MHSDKKFIRQSDAAVIIGVHPNTMCNWRHAGYGPPYYQLGPNLAAYDEEEVREWLAAQHKLASKANGKALPPPTGKRALEAQEYFKEARKRG